MIIGIHDGDITSCSNELDIIIGMNTRLAEASAIGRRVLVDKSITKALKLGDIITFKFDERDMRVRYLHMIICHQMVGENRWADADKYIRCALDSFWRKTRGAEFSIVKIGDGPVGRRDGADFAAIHKAMVDSFLPLHLFVWDEKKRAAANVVNLPPLEPLRTWSFEKGRHDVRIAA